MVWMWGNYKLFPHLLVCATRSVNTHTHTNTLGSNNIHSTTLIRQNNLRMLKNSKNSMHPKQDIRKSFQQNLSQLTIDH